MDLINNAVFIFDIDGTLAYNNSNRDIAKFPPIKETLEIALAAQKSGKAKLAIVTARPEELRDDTEKWVSKQGLNPDILLMRSDDDERPDHKVRVDQVSKVREKLGKNAVLFDDKLENCKAVKDNLKIPVRRVIS